MATLLGKECLEFLTFLPTGRLPRGLGIAMTPPPTPPWSPGQCCSVIGRNDPGGLQHFFDGGGGWGLGEGKEEYL